MGVLSPAGAARERKAPCRVCGHGTFSHDLICQFCRCEQPDPHAAAEAKDAAMAERYS